jgi:hypothetical protein
MSAPAPDLKPHVPPTPPGSEACGCCDGIASETPQSLNNRPGLSALAYRIGDHAQFRASVHASLSSSQFAPLARLRTRNDADFTIGLIDAFACAAHVLTFYSERIANESYLRTATERISLQELGKLVGYRLRPGLAAETRLAFALEMPPKPPATLAPEPGNFVTGLPHSITLDVGLQVQSVPGPGEKPQTFETVEPLAEARATWNAMQPWLSEPRSPVSGDTDLWLAGTALNLKPGDALLFVGKDFLQGPTSDHWDFRLLTAVEPDNDAGRTRVVWARGLKAVFPASDPSRQPVVYALRKRAAVYGHNAPLWRSMNDDFRTGYKAKFGGEITDLEWPNFVLSPAGQSGVGGNIDLDSVQLQIAVDIATTTDPARRSFAVVAKGDFNRSDGKFSKDTFVDLYRITNTIEVSRTEFALSGKVTRLVLAGNNHLDTVFFNQVRETSVFAQSELLPLAEHPISDPVVGDMVPVAVVPDGLLSGRRLVVRGKRTSDKATIIHEAALVVAHPEADASHCKLEIKPTLADTLVRDSVVVHGNVVLASHGETVSQILGAGDASVPFQRFELKQLPLTWRAAENEAGARNELTVRIADIAWAERQTLFGAALTERGYTLEVDEQGRNFVAFGDGIRGTRLPSGVNNVRATYRKGLGSDGNVGPDKLTQLVTRPLGLKSVSNPLAAEGGTDPEPASAARQSIPLTTRTLGRAVSLLDYEDFARGFSGIAKARAQVLALPAGTTIAITIAGPDGAQLTEASPVWTNLLAALRKNGDPHVAVMLLPALLSTFRLGLTVKRDRAFEAKSVLAAVETALRAHFAFTARELGQPVQQSDAIAVAQAVPGVVAVDITRLYGGTQPLVQTKPSKQVRLLASRMRVEGGVARPAELLTLDPAPFDSLEEMA